MRELLPIIRCEFVSSPSSVAYSDAINLRRAYAAKARQLKERTTVGKILARAATTTELDGGAMSYVRAILSCNSGPFCCAPKRTVL